MIGKLIDSAQIALTKGRLISDAVTCVHEAIHRCKMRLLCLAWLRRKNFVP